MVHLPGRLERGSRMSSVLDPLATAAVRSVWSEISARPPAPTSGLAVGETVILLTPHHRLY